MKAFGAVIIFLILFMAVLVMIAFFYLRKLFLKFQRHITGDYDEETFKRMADKHYKGDGDGPKFDKDYFKGSGMQNRGFRNWNAEQTAKPNAGKEQRTKQSSARTTTTEGITIIDERNYQKSKQKIFEKDEGEYVDFVEEA
jgi:hypothetical protein